ncbi:hypothetical protein ATY77_28585 [Rhizobium sp. R634]|uniref:hypothetical protein n=1 Tax=Rhizobium sp. R634 TaxID=1764274 RepID=UPI000B52DE57|nr:hypothetical protein [Rhizobium sp. R634]OWV78355.1 hypothetical protein ATY77_28585 [Rhizobium sp. R634]
MSKSTSTDEQLTELRALEALEDKDIDTSDIPERVDNRWRFARKDNFSTGLSKSSSSPDDY